jgi:hypothetical protein
VRSHAAESATAYDGFGKPSREDGQDCFLELVAFQWMVLPSGKTVTVHDDIAFVSFFEA